MSCVITGVPVLSTNVPQALKKVRIYPGADATFTLYQDDGKTYNYEKGESKITLLHWDNASGKLTHDGSSAWTGPDDALLEVVGRK